MVRTPSSPPSVSLTLPLLPAPPCCCSLFCFFLQLFLEQNEEEAEKMAEKEEKAREIEKSTIKVSEGLPGGVAGSRGAGCMGCNEVEVRRTDERSLCF